MRCTTPIYFFSPLGCLLFAQDLGLLTGGISSRTQSTVEGHLNTYGISTHILDLINGVVLQCKRQVLFRHSALNSSTSLKKKEFSLPHSNMAAVAGGERRMCVTIFSYFAILPSPARPWSCVQAGVAVWSQLAGSGCNEYAL